MLGDWLGSLDKLKLGTNIDNEVEFSDGKVPNRTLRNIDEWIVGLVLVCNESNRLSLGYGKLVGILLDLLMVLYMTLIWSILISYAEKLVCKNMYCFWK